MVSIPQIHLTISGRLTASKRKRKLSGQSEIVNENESGKGIDTSRNLCCLICCHLSFLL